MTQDATPDSSVRTTAGDSPKAPNRAGMRVREPFAGKRGGSPFQGMRTPDYLIIGHITADLMDDGTVKLGGTALYSALTARRLGASVAILTRGKFGGEIAGMRVPGLDEYADDLQIIVQDADVPTTFVNEYLGSRRVQHVKHWAGPIDLRGLPTHWSTAKIVHLGPVADEIDPRRVTGITANFLGVTPQGWLRDWPRQQGGRVTHIPLRLPVDLVNRIDCAIVSDEEIFQTRDFIETVGERRLSVVTRGPLGATIYHARRDDEPPLPRGRKQISTIDIPQVNVKVKSLTGAGDVFAAAFFMKASDRRSSAREAGMYANAVAALSLREVGVGTIPTRREIEDTIKREYADEGLRR